MDKTITIEVEDNALDADAFREFSSLIRHLSDDQCRKALRILVLGQPTESADTAMLARIADYLAFGAKYSGMEREVAVEAFKDTLTVDNLRDAWEKCDF